MKHRRKHRRGFTLLEVLLVLAILGVIAAMVVPQLLGTQRKAMIDATRSGMEGLEQTLKLYAIHHDAEFPHGNQETLVSSLLKPTDRDGNDMAPYLDDQPKDAWGQMFFYEWPNTKGGSSTKPAIWSSGPNKQNEDGSGDDINNWSQSDG